MRDLIKATLPLIGKDKNVLATGGLELGTSKLRDCHTNHFAATTALGCLRLLIGQSVLHLSEIRIRQKVLVQKILTEISKQSR